MHGSLAALHIRLKWTLISQASRMPKRTPHDIPIQSDPAFCYWPLVQGSVHPAGPLISKSQAGYPRGNVVGPQCLVAAATPRARACVVKPVLPHFESRGQEPIR